MTFDHQNPVRGHEAADGCPDPQVRTAVESWKDEGGHFPYLPDGAAADTWPAHAPVPGSRHPEIGAARDRLFSENPDRGFESP